MNIVTQKQFSINRGDGQNLIFDANVFVMPTASAAKLRIREGFVLLTINAPADFEHNIGKLPTDVVISPTAKKFDQIHWFVLNKAQVGKNLPRVLKLLRDDILLWIYYPKGSSGMQTDLTRDKGWDALLSHTELAWINLISFNDTWSAFASRLKNQQEKKVSKSSGRTIFEYVDPKTKAVRLPDDLAGEFLKHRKQEEFFNNLSFTNRKEYIEWIVTAKKIETRKERVKGTIERLRKGWKNPRNI